MPITVLLTAPSPLQRTLTLRDLTLKHYFSSMCLKYHFQAEPHLQPSPKIHHFKTPKQKLSFAINPAHSRQLQLCLRHLLQAELHSFLVPQVTGCSPAPIQRHCAPANSESPADSTSTGVKKLTGFQVRPFLYSAQGKDREHKALCG